MATPNFDEPTLAGENAVYAQIAADLKDHFSFDFVAIGMTVFVGGALRWIYSAGASNERYRRILLAPGHGIGGIVLKAGKPMMCANIEEDMDPREFSSYPIVFAEDLHSFCALPLLKNERVVAVLLCAMRSADPSFQQRCQQLVQHLNGDLCGMRIVSDDYVAFEYLVTLEREAQADLFLGSSLMARTVSAQEDERRRISRELHDGIGQELLALNFNLERISQEPLSDAGQQVIQESKAAVQTLINEVRTLSVTLRPSTLDHFGLSAALRSQAEVLEKTYGSQVIVKTPDEMERFDQAMETQVYRVCQEAMLNACKYAGRNEVVVELSCSNGWLQASVTDSGEGFNVEQPTVKGTGCGLANMRERARLTGGTLTIESSSRGTSVTLVAPMNLSTAEEQA